MTTVLLPEGVTIIEPGVVHGPAIAELHKRCFDESWSAFTVRQILVMPGAFGLLAADKGHTGLCVNGSPSLLGFALCRAGGGECELLSLAVAVAARSRGIGAALLAGVVERARERAISRMFLEVAEDNAIAQCLYKAHGFRPVGRRPNYYRRPQSPSMAALTYAVSLGNQPAG
jgi:ribosomal-protein-alanine N-acetyltransferase